MNPWLYLAAVNALTFLLYWHDKRAARRNGVRVPEYVLFLAGFLGGTVGAIFAQQLLRHKTKKLRFRVSFWMLTALQIFLIFHPPIFLKMLWIRVFSPL